MRKIETLRRSLACLLTACMLMTLLPVSALAEGTKETPEIVTVTAFDPLEETVAAQTVPCGTAREDLNLPDTLQAIGDPDTETVTMDNVTWTPDTPYVGAAGRYIFTAAAAGYACADGVNWPVITVTVEALPTPYEAVAARFAALPAPEDVAGMSDEEKDALSAQISGALNALFALPDEDYQRFTAEHAAYLRAVQALQIALTGGTETLDNDTVSTVDALSTAITNSTGTAEAPTVITIDAAGVSVDKAILIDGKHIKLTGGTLTRATAYHNNLIEVKNGGSLTLENITLDGNKGNGATGGTLINLALSANLTIEAGAVLQNNKGSAINVGYQFSGCVHLVMNAGEIKNNDGDNKGAAIMFGAGSAAAGTLEIHGGTISGNTLTSTKENDTYGAAIYSDSTFIMTGGLITENLTHAGRGGGVYLTGGSTRPFIMTGGTISGNTARTGNYVGGNGHNVYVNQCAFTLGDAANIPDGLYLKLKSSTFSIASPLQNPVEIEAIYSYPASGDLVASGAGDDTVTADDLAKFSYKNGRFSFALDPDHNQIRLGELIPDPTQYSTTGTGIIYANGAPLLLTAGTTPGNTVVYKDVDRSGTVTHADSIVSFNVNGVNNQTTEGNNLSNYTIYGGSGRNSNPENNTDYTGNTSITMLGGKVSAIYGGSQGIDTKGTVTGNTSVTVKGGTVSTVYGGGNKTGGNNVDGNTSVTIAGGTIGVAYGGGNGGGAITGDATLNITGGTIGAGSSNSMVCGGGNGPVNGTASVNITGGEVNALIFGGGYGGAAANSSVSVSGGEITGALYGGGLSGNTTGAASVTMTGGALSKSSDSYYDGRIYGGNMGSAAGSQSVTVGGTPTLAGVVIGTTTGVSSVAIEPNLSGTTPIPLILPSGFNGADKPVIATGAVKADLSHLSLSGPNVAELMTYYDETDHTIRVRSTFAGKGTAEDPYLIETYDDLATLAETVNSGTNYKNKSFQVSDRFDPASGTVTTPIGAQNKSFAGTFDGGGKTIALAIDLSSADYAGLFGQIGNGGIVKKTGVSGSVKGRILVGGIAGIVGDPNGSGTVEACWSTAAVTGTESSAGGIAGSIGVSGTVRDSWNAGPVTGSSGVGGVAGMNNKTLQNCYNTGPVTGSSRNVGGVVGITSNNTTLQNCYNTGPVTGGESNIGGVSGFSSNTAKVSGCVSLGETVTSSATTLGRVVGTAYSGGDLENNRARADQRMGPAGSEAVPTENLDATKVNGQSVAVDNTSALSEVFSGWDRSVWSIPDGSLRIGCPLPTLKGCAPASASVLPGKLIAPAITTEALPAGTLGASYSQALTATGTAPIIWSTVAGNLPDGLTLNNDGVITGIPTAVGTFPFTVKASNPWAPPDTTKELSIVVAQHPGTEYGGYTTALNALKKVHIVTNVTPTLADVTLPEGWAFTDDTAERLTARSENEGKQRFSVQYTPPDTNYAPVLLTGNDAPQIPVSTITLTATGGLDMVTIDGIGNTHTLSGMGLTVTGAALPDAGDYAIGNMVWSSRVPDVATVSGGTVSISGMSATVASAGAGVTMVGIAYQNGGMLGYVLVKVTGGETENSVNDLKDITETLDKLIDPQSPTKTDKAAVDAVADEVTKLPDAAKNTLQREDIEALDALKTNVGKNVATDKLNIIIKDDAEAADTPKPTDIQVVGAAIACGVNSGDVVVSVQSVPPTSSDTKLELQMELTVDTGSGAVETQLQAPMFFQMDVPEGIDFNQLTLYHVKDDGNKTELPFTVVGGRTIAFKMLSFSSVQFVVSTKGTSGGGGGGTAYTLTATAGTGGAIAPSGKVRVSRNSSKTFTITPNAGYEIAHVLVDGKNVGTVKSYTFENVTRDHTIAASFQAEGQRPAWNPFADVKDGDWYYDSVKYVYQRGLMNGTGKTTFSPGLSTTRGMMVTILWRLEQEPDSGAAMAFEDVKTDSYYYEAVRWAAEHGIVKGYSPTVFGPDHTITRQELTAILYRYAQDQGADVRASDNLTAFTDQPDPWASDAIKWAVGAGILSGKGNGVLNPRGHATRAEAAAMLTRFLQRNLE